MLNYNKIAVMLPTYGHSENKLPKFIGTLMDSVANLASIAIIFVVNRKDTATIAFINNRLAGVMDYEILYEDLQEPNFAAYFNIAYTQTKYNEPERLVSMFGDDFEFKTYGWDKLFLKYANQFGGFGLFFGDDMLQAGVRLAVFFVVTRQVVDAISPMPFMCELFPVDDIDVVWDQTMESLGHRFYIPEIKVFHNHATIKGNKDPVWDRSRKQLSVTVANREKGPGYTDKCIEKIASALAEDLRTDRVAVVVVGNNKDARDTIKHVMMPAKTTNPVYAGDYQKLWDKYENKYLPRPERLTVVSNVQQPIAERFNTVDVKTCGLGVDMYFSAMQTAFNGPDIDAVVALDDTCTPKKYWWMRVLAARRQMMEAEDIACISIAGAPEYADVAPSPMPGMVRLLDPLLVGTVVSRRFWEKCIKDTNGTGDWWRDACYLAIDDGMKVLATEISFIDMPGIAKGIAKIGTQQTAMNTPTLQQSLVAAGLPADFGPKHPEWVIPSRRNKYYKIAQTEQRVPITVREKTVLFIMPGRLGDTLMTAPLANDLISRGYKLTWLTTNVYESLVRTVCPDAEIALYAKDTDWIDAKTSEARAIYPDYQYYLNMQPGSTDNNHKWVGTGFTMVEFVCSVIRKEMGINCGLRWNIDAVGLPDVAKINTHGKPLCIIAPEIVSTPAVWPEGGITAVYNQYKDEYDVKILVKDKTPFAGYQEGAVLSGYTFLQCISLLRQCTLFIGQDSGLAWAAMYSTLCRKIIYHTKKRISETNMFFTQIDNTYEDVVL